MEGDKKNENQEQHAFPENDPNLSNAHETKGKKKDITQIMNSMTKLIESAINQLNVGRNNKIG